MTQDEIRAFLLTKPDFKDLLLHCDFEEQRKCWCGGELRPWLDEFAAYRICSACECKTVRYMPTPASLQYLYADSGYYWTGYQYAHGCPSVEQRFENDLHDRIPQYLSWIRNLARPPARTLEVGCGPGRLLYETAGAGYDAHACEMDARVASFASTKSGRPVFTGPLPPRTDQPFDLIIVIDVFEHVPDPVRFADEVSRRLKRGGKLLLHLPIIDSDEDARRWRDMFSPLSHLWMHSTGRSGGFGSISPGRGDR